MSQPDGSVFEMEFPVEVWLASQSVPLGRLLDLQPGDEMPLQTNTEERVDLMANGVKLASGELVVVDGKFGIRITETASMNLAGMGSESPTKDGKQNEEDEEQNEETAS